VLMLQLMGFLVEMLCVGYQSLCSNRQQNYGVGYLTPSRHFRERLMMQVDETGTVTGNRMGCFSGTDRMTCEQTGLGPQLWQIMRTGYIVRG
jgi:hypothetical protein